MKLHRSISLPIILSSIITLSAHGMEPAVAKALAGRQDIDEIVKQAQQYNDMHPLIRLLPELQQQIIFPQYTQSTEIKWSKMTELEQCVKTFFTFNIVCKYFNQHLKLPWSDLKIEQKNKMLKGSIDYTLLLGGHPTSGYEIVVPLALIYSGANADIKSNFLCHPSCLFIAVADNTESAVAMLLKHNADPYQIDKRGNPICFLAETVAIVNLFLTKIDKEELLSKSKCVGFHLLQAAYSLEIMKFWFDYGVNPCDVNGVNDSIFHELVRSIYWADNSVDNILTKGEFLLKRIPNMINTVYKRGETPVDKAIWEKKLNGPCISAPDKYEKLIALFRKYGGKTRKELEAEKITIDNQEFS